MSPALSIATTCKPFRGDAARIQRNALESWVRLAERPDVLVFGDEPGVAEVCGELGLRHQPKVERTEAGTPVLSDLVASAEREARAGWIALVNADIMLTSGIYRVLAAIQPVLPRCLVLARRWNLDLDEDWDFAAPDWEGRLLRRAFRDGVLEPRFGGVDVFLFPKGVWGDERLPSFAIGRGRWDSGIIHQARHRSLAVVDATALAHNVHQNHDYSHHPRAVEGVFKGPEASRNDALLGGATFIFSALDATHVLDERGLRRNVVLHPLLTLRKLGTLPARVPALRPLSRVVDSLAPAWRRGRSVLDRARARLSARSSRLPRRGGHAPYPGAVAARPVHGLERPPGGGTADFDKPAALELNRARLEHLAGLGLPLTGRRVLDVGAGPGHLARFFVERGCQVVCLEARPENLARMADLYPDLDGRRFDVERNDWSALGRFDVVFCYGLLYHLEDPFGAIRRMASVCDDLLLLSTLVADHELPLVVMEEETAACTQALHNVGCRPTPSFVCLALRGAGFEHVYAPATPPDHPDYRFGWRNDLASTRRDHLLRCVFVASRRPIDLGTLVPLLREPGAAQA